MSKETFLSNDGSALPGLQDVVVNMSFLDAWIVFPSQLSKLHDQELEPIDRLYRNVRPVDMNELKARTPWIGWRAYKNHVDDDENGAIQWVD